MAHIEGESRYQRTLFPQSLDDVVSGDHVVRVIDAFINGLDLAGLGFSPVMVAAAPGRPAYRPSDLLKLYTYGYLNQIRSSRRLEREAERNVEVMWLINRLTPCFKTVADFRKDHPDAIAGVSRAFVAFCRGLSLYGGSVIAVDGSKIEAVASRKQVITPKSLERQAAVVERKIAEYLKAMDTADQEEATSEEPAVDVAAALKVLRTQQRQVREQAEMLAKEGLKQYVVGEDEARLMRTPRHGHQVAYNAQIVVDAEHGLIAAFDLTNEGNDHRLLHPMAEQGQAALQAETLTVVADTGYSNGEQARQCEDAGIIAIVPRPQTVNPEGKEFFTRDAFTYDAATDSYQCPAEQTLTLRDTSQTERKKRYTTKACHECPLKPRCTKAEQRTIIRDFNEDARDAMHQRALADPKWMQQRRCLVEHPFGTMKHLMGYPKFLVRGLKKAKAELSLTVLSFNIKRTITILGVPALLAALQRPA